MSASLVWFPSALAIIASLASVVWNLFPSTGATSPVATSEWLFTCTIVLYESARFSIPRLSLLSPLPIPAITSELMSVCPP